MLGARLRIFHFSISQFEPKKEQATANSIAA
jgi:hypothetical protein